MFSSGFLNKERSQEGVPVFSIFLLTLDSMHA